MPICRTILEKKVNPMQQLEEEVKQVIIDVLQLEDITPADIVSDAPLFVDGLGLDSIDALELVVKLKQFTGKRLQPDVFKAVRTVQDMVDALAALFAEDTK